MNIGRHPIAVCDWSLRCADLASMVACVKQLGLEHVHLGLCPLVDEAGQAKWSQVELLRQSGLKFSAGMVGYHGEDYSTIASIRRSGGFVPADLWPQRRGRLMACGKVAAMLGITQVSTHIGFVPHTSEAGYKPMVGRVQDAADGLAAAGISLLMETGQESAEGLLLFLEEVGRANVGVNFDPANMILYGAGDPIRAVGVLGRHIRHVHIKDALASTNPGVEWGKEVAFGQGAVDAARFVAALEAQGYCGVLAIEREAGPQRMEDVREAMRVLGACSHELRSSGGGQITPAGK